MTRKLISVAATALFLTMAPFASATTISFDFSGFGLGVAVNDYYNGGSDSLGRTGGPNYGVTFSGTIGNTPRGAYLAPNLGASAVVMTIDPDRMRALLGADQYYVGFNAANFSVDGGPANLYYENSKIPDNQWITGNGNPYCPRYPAYCNLPSYWTMGAYLVGPWSPTSQIIGIGFHANRIDNVIISTTPIRPSFISGNYEMDRDIPEPASIALIGIGVAGLLVRRRKKNGVL
jgi:hypothetical protein